VPHPDFLDTAAVGEIPDNGTLSVRLPTGEQVCLLRCRGELTAFLDECPHQGMPLSAGEILPDGTLECSWHGARFDCRTGAVRQGPAEVPATAFDVRVEGDRVLVSARPRP